MLKGFKEFLLRGNIVDLAVAVVIGTAFTALVGKFTESIINPLIAATGGSNAGAGLGFFLKDGVRSTFVNIGAVINAAITFTITAAVVYFVVVVPMKKIQDRRAAGLEPEPEAVAEDIALLREIRDSLQNR